VVWNVSFPGSLNHKLVTYTMTSYPDTPSYVLDSGKLLQDVLNEKKEALIGKTVLAKYGADLPFLPKILSIAKALPLQIHPNKDLATRLHKKDPEKFTDDNHKPEIAVALSKFELFVGFKPLADLQKLMNLPPLRQFIPKGDNQQFNDESVRDICGAMLTASESTVASVHDQLLKTSREDLGSQAYLLDLLPRVAQQYSKEDNGNLVALIAMNFLTLSPGQAIYVPADGIHAYLAGDIVECMARSNNVINTGFCPRADRDSIELFTNALTFEQHHPDQPILQRLPSANSKNGKTTEYQPPLSEFNMMITELKSGEKEGLREVQGPSTMIVTEGAGKMTAGGKEYELKEGWIFFIGQGVEVEISAEKQLALYRAYAE